VSCYHLVLSGIARNSNIHEISLYSNHHQNKLLSSFRLHLFISILILHTKQLMR